MHFARLARIDAFLDGRKRRAAGRFGVALELRRKQRLDMGEKVPHMALLGEDLRRAPVFVIKAAHEHRQLRAQMHRIHRHQPVAQRMQRRAQGGKRDAPVVGAKLAQHDFQIAVGFVERLVEDLETRVAHRTFSE